MSTQEHPQHPSERTRLEKDSAESRNPLPDSPITLKPVPRTELRSWTATLTFPESQFPNCIYKTGTFHFTITIPDANITYPFRAPKIISKTKIYSPHVHPETGVVRFSTLDEDAWSPVVTLQKMMEGLVEALLKPVPAYAADEEIGREYKNERNKFLEKAREWTRLYAME